MATVLVTGGSGFIGSHAILQLLADGHAVRSTIDFARTTTTNIADSELHCATDGHVGAIALAEHVDAAIHSNCPRAWSATHNHWTNRHRGG